MRKRKLKKLLDDQIERNLSLATTNVELDRKNRLLLWQVCNYKQEELKKYLGHYIIRDKILYILTHIGTVSCIENKEEYCVVVTTIRLELEDITNINSKAETSFFESEIIDSKKLQPEEEDRINSTINQVLKLNDLSVWQNK